MTDKTEMSHRRDNLIVNLMGGPFAGGVAGFIEASKVTNKGLGTWQK